MRRRAIQSLSFLVLLAASCGTSPEQPVEGLKAFVGGTVVDPSQEEPLADAVIVARQGRIEAVGAAASTQVPEGAETIDVSGKFLAPGFILGHGHVGGSQGLETGPSVYTRENLLDQLGLYARYGVTTVVSLGGDGEEAVRLRDAQDESLDRARLFLAGAVVVGDTPDEARAMVDQNAEMKADFIKIRVDDNLGSSKKMSPEVYRAVIDRAHELGLPVAAHIYYLEDAKALLRAGVDFIAHSVRDKPVDDELIQLLKENNVCLCPTLTREVSTYVYEDVPEFFDDPFFLAEADPAVLEQLKAPEAQKAIRDSRSAQQYKKALDTASENLKKLVDAGVRIVFGTDTGPPARFQGYFEHMEMELMAEAGLTPQQILRSATADAAECLGLDELGALETGKWADFVVLAENPLTDIANTRTLESVWIAGNQVPERPEESDQGQAEPAE